MHHVKHYRCTLCQKTFAKSSDFLTCPTCGEKGILDIEYDYVAMKNVVTKQYFAENKVLSMWRYLPMMSVADANLDRVLAVGWTPLYRMRRLEAHFDMKTLYLKDEGVQPSGSLKDRASAVAVLKALEAKASVVACSSTGNAASSLSSHAAKAGLRSVIFVPKRAPVGKLVQLAITNAELIRVDGDYKATFSLSKFAIDRYGWYNRNAAINPHLVEGKKTVALEIAEQLSFDVPDWVIVSVGDGCTIAGVYKGFYDLKQCDLIDKIPRLLGVQSSGCSPFYTAWKNQTLLEETLENTIADSIAVGIPRNPVKGLNAVKNSHGAFITVSDEEIFKAMRLLGSKEGIFAEPASAASIAGLENALKDGTILKHESVAIVHTGNGLKDPENAQKAIALSPIISTDHQELERYLKKQGAIQ